MSTAESFLLLLLVIFALPYAAWRLGATDAFAPLVVVQIVAGVLLGPGVLGAWQPKLYAAVFTPGAVQVLTGIAWWGVMLFVWLAGIELDLAQAWRHRRETGITAAAALGVPLALGCVAGGVLLALDARWMGREAQSWQYVAGIGMSCAVTALPILVLLLEKLQMLRTPIGQRVLRYASLDDVAIWAVLAAILMDWHRMGWQLAFLAAYAAAAAAMRRWMPALPTRDRWHIALVWLIACAFGADVSGLHFMVGAFLAGAAMEARWFGQHELDALRDHVLLIAMPVFFLSTGLKTEWNVGGQAVLLAAALLLVAAVAGKLLGTSLAGRLLKWERQDARLVGWLLQTKALIMIVFANVLLDKRIISSDSFTALLLMAVASTMLTVPMVRRILGAGASPAPAAASAGS